jgi:putative hydrolase of the HAD superfamily
MPHYGHSITCILFDLDNTLTDRDKTISRFSERFLADFRSRLRPDMTIAEVHQVMRAGDGGGYRPKEIMFAEVLSHLDWVDPPDILTIADYWYRVSAECMQLRIGVVEMLDVLKEHGFRLGIITNGKTDVQNATIDAVGIRPRFDVILVSETVGFRKPDARIFQLALDAMQLPASATLFVGDHPEADIQGASRAGLHTAWLAGMHPWLEGITPSEFTIHQLLDLVQILI